MKIYLARAMTGRPKIEVVKEAKEDAIFFGAAGFNVLCPVIAENVKPEPGAIDSSKAQMDTYWKRDKEMIREAHAVLDMSPLAVSEGVRHETGYARYALWKPVVRIYPQGKLPSQASIAYYEDDFICDSKEEAIEYLLRVHGTFLRRMLWRARLLRRSFPRWVIFQLGEIK